MVHYKPINVTINALDLAEIIINLVVRYYGFLDSIVNSQGSLFTSKFWSSLCYFLSIKQKLFTTFYPQTNGPNERQNSIIEAYLSVFVNFKQNNWARLLLMAEFAYNNAKNACTGYTSFELNCGYYLCISYKEEKILNLCSKSKTAKKLSSELQKLMTVCKQNLHHIQEFKK